MKILLVTTGLEPSNGYGRYGFDLADGLTDAGHTVVAAVAEKSDQAEQRQHEILENSKKYLLNFRVAWRSARRLKQVIAQERPEVVHIVAEPYASIFKFLRVNAKLVLTAHGTYCYPPLLLQGWKRRMSEFMYKAAYDKMNRVITVSSFTKEYLLDNIEDTGFKNRLADKSTIITNGINLKRFAGRQEKKKENRVKQILFVGAVKPRKGLLEAVEALAAYKKKYGGGFVYNIVGNYQEDDKYFRKLQSRIKEMRLEENIKFHGRVSEEKLREFYEQADLFLMLSRQAGKRFEGFGLVYLEANAYGVPCIGNIKSGARDAIKDGVSGYLVDCDNIKEIAVKIIDSEKLVAKEAVEWAKYNSTIRKTVNIMNYYNNN